MSDMGHFSSIISHLLARSTSSDPPCTPLHEATQATLGSPAKPTPSKLHRFLQHAKDQLGVKNAKMYEAILNIKGYGPDILHLVNDKALIEAGLPHGDAICIKAGSQAWWKSADAKRKRSDTDEDDGASGSRTPPNKKVWYERVYKDGTGGNTFWGPVLVAGSSWHADYDLHYFCPARREIGSYPSRVLCHRGR